jgi:hypothetical protein
MKKLDINQLDDSDEEIAEILISSGMSRPVAEPWHIFEKSIQLHPLILRGEQDCASLKSA